ncbi:1-deoxy-D-xylulose-5-phosphate reductoisomerase [Pseudalkalibacillus salsuginis]|uniref:1-deoxy-D-xylulose-5-phosphate reductoisomerase n=1 Tax=Pseudalkalibacillus salsuginis TaxID=2910972 RepID=UPI001F20CAE9|nr:1-deoxy-D-xylulose-5-phosphate reductoisomerase [Pseudalkalibacillus salsuginis]MCF6410602.1 1-deoxy-D-xylulose-5-phosphate reductoisomerase [Pseudalkalibacillus salsuginis]
MKYISILGATGSIGTQTFEVVRAHPEQFKITSFSFGMNIKLGVELIKEFQPDHVSVATKELAEELKRTINPTCLVYYGEEGLLEIATDPASDILVNAVMGSVGLEPTLAAIEEGKTIAIANKETLVTAGHIVMDRARKKNVDILPVDSEHSAIYQCLKGEEKREMSRLILTASGGSFRDRSRADLQGVTVEEALNHPNWAMGSKITIDSATMMNKGLEVIEAHWLFDTKYEDIEVVLHRESVIHSMVEFIDGSVIAHLGTPDMKVPIQYALSHPSRLELPSGKRLNLVDIGTLHFEKMDFERFPCLKFAFAAGKAGGTTPTVLNASNETAVEAFLKGRIEFLEIETLIDKALNQHESIKEPSLEEIREVDNSSRRFVQSLIV